MQRGHEQKVQELMTKLKKNQKEMASLAKGNKQQNKSSLTIVRGSSSSFTPSSLTYSDISSGPNNSANNNDSAQQSAPNNENDQPESGTRRANDSSDSESNSSRGSD